MEHQKYPRTWHLPWSLGATDDDKTLNNASQFYGKRVIVSKKFDGENTTGHADGHVHARSLDSRGGEDRAWVKSFIRSWCYNLPEGWRVCGENLWAKHSIPYDDLPSYFLCFSIWDNTNRCLRWDDTVVWAEKLGLTLVPVLYDGVWDEAVVRSLEKNLDLSKDEGYVVRVASEFKYEQFKSSVAKFVRAGHVTTDDHWRHQQIVPNKLKKD